MSSRGFRRRAAIAFGCALQLVMPWGFWKTGAGIWRVAANAHTTDFLPLYVDIWLATQPLLLAAGLSSLGLLFVAWGALPARSR